MKHYIFAPAQYNPQHLGTIGFFHFYYSFLSENLDLVYIAISIFNHYSQLIQRRLQGETAGCTESKVCSFLGVKFDVAFCHYFLEENIVIILHLMLTHFFQTLLKQYFRWMSKDRWLLIQRLIPLDSVQFGKEVFACHDFLSLPWTRSGKNSV